MFCGARRSMAFFRSSTTPDSNSIVVTPAVDQGTNTVTTPAITFDLSTADCILSVRSCVSLNPRVFTTMVWDRINIVMSLRVLILNLKKLHSFNKKNNHHENSSADGYSRRIQKGDRHHKK